MRGKAAETHAAGFREGITPAYAGKSYVHKIQKVWK